MVHLSSAAATMADYQSLIGLEWEYGKQDCYTIVRRYFALQHIELPDFPRPNDIENSKSIYLSQASALGFKPVSFEQRQVGDVAIMKLGTAEPMHAAIFVEPWRILHHCQHRVSGVDWVRRYHIESIWAIYRHAARPSAG